MSKLDVDFETSKLLVTEGGKSASLISVFLMKLGMVPAVAIDQFRCFLLNKRKYLTNVRPHRGNNYTHVTANV